MTVDVLIDVILMIVFIFVYYCWILHCPRGQRSRSKWVEMAGRLIVVQLKKEQSKLLEL